MRFADKDSHQIFLEPEGRIMQKSILQRYFHIFFTC
ncbi:MAG: hypothetical protein Q9N67_01065 [Ghiorsea sp.]|nr:hypothetical protein [Ghiorsea sp.]